jgi:co-chaperonin GroES (HSP10)
MMKARPLGHRILLKMEGQGEQKSAGGLIIDTGTKEEDSEIGVVVDMGKNCFS